MQSVQEKALVLKTQRYDDRSIIVTLLTPTFGRVTAIAPNGIQSKRFGASLQIFNEIQAEISRPKTGTLWRLLQSHSLTDYTLTFLDYRKLVYGSFGNELTARITPQEEPSLSHYQLHEAFIRSLSEAINNEESLDLLNQFLLGCLRLLGLTPQTKACWVSKRPLHHLQEGERVWARLSDAAWCFEKHRSEFQLGGEALYSIDGKTLLKFYASTNDLAAEKFQIVPFEERDQASILSYLVGLFQYHVPGLDRLPIKSLESLLKLSNEQYPVGHPQQNPL